MPVSPALPDPPPAIIEPTVEDDVPTHGNATAPALPIRRAGPLGTARTLRDTQAHICDEAFYQEQILTHPSLPPAAPALPFPDFREEAAVISSALEGGDALIERRTTHAASRGASVEVVMLQNLMSQFGGGGGAMGRRSNAGGDEIGGGTLCGGADVIRADTLDMPCVGGRLSAGDAGAASTAASAASSLTEKLALQMALQRVSRVRPLWCLIQHEAKQSESMWRLLVTCARYRVHRIS